MARKKWTVEPNELILPPQQTNKPLPQPPPLLLQIPIDNPLRAAEVEKKLQEGAEAIPLQANPSTKTATTRWLHTNAIRNNRIKRPYLQLSNSLVWRRRTCKLMLHLMRKQQRPWKPHGIML
jgi:hypothetical protein